MKHLWLTHSSKSEMGHEAVQYRRCRLAWESQGWVDCWNSNSYQSLWHVGKANSVDLSRTNYFVISWENPFQTVHSTRKHDIQTFSVLLWNTKKYESFGNLSLFLLDENLVWKQLWALGSTCLCTAWEPGASSPVPCSTCLSLAVLIMEGWSLWGFQREAEMEWKCCAIYICTLWGFSEGYTGCALQSTPLYALTLRKTRRERYSCHEHCVAFMPSLPSQRDCWRPDGNERYTAVNHEPFTSPTVQSEKNQDLPPKTQNCWRCSWGLPFVCN